MKAEIVFALLLLVFAAGFVVGDLARRRSESDRARRRVERVRGLYLGGVREW